ncbi:MAG: adenylate/guanylate cyclase domain-containing protein [Acidimicrobiales bacterium]
MGHPQLVVRSPARHALTVVLDHPLEVGREADGLVIDDAKVSRRHAIFEPVSATSVRVRDLGSSNGTYVDGVAVTTAVVLRGGQSAQLGDVTIEVIAADEKVVRPASRQTVMGERSPRATSMELVAAAVSTQGVKPEVIGVADEAGTLTIVFSDIESSTERALAVGDVRWMEILGRHNGLFKAHVDAHRGRIVKNQGDGYLLCFPSARQALLCSIGVQRDLERVERERPEHAVRVRIGMHTGEVLLDDEGDLFGRHVLIAARVGAAAAGSEILVSSLVRQIAEPRGDLIFGPATDLELKGIDQITTVHTVDWRASPVAASTSP